MPFYGSNIPAGNVSETSPGFPQRFPNTVWQQPTVPSDAATMSKFFMRFVMYSSKINQIPCYGKMFQVPMREVRVNEERKNTCIKL